MAEKSKSAVYYAKNPDARAKKNAYQKEYNKKPSAVKHRVSCNKGRKDLGLKVGDKRDASHTKSGKVVKEKASTNRARNGANGKSTKK